MAYICYVTKKEKLFSLRSFHCTLSPILNHWFFGQVEEKQGRNPWYREHEPPRSVAHRRPRNLTQIKLMWYLNATLLHLSIPWVTRFYMPDHIAKARSLIADPVPNMSLSLKKNPSRRNQTRSSGWKVRHCRGSRQMSHAFLSLFSFFVHFHLLCRFLCDLCRQGPLHAYLCISLRFPVFHGCGRRVTSV